MELRICESPEPSHIHIPRPSRLASFSGLEPRQIPVGELSEDLTIIREEVEDTDPDEAAA
jgi:hypothetical protein